MLNKTISNSNVFFGDAYLADSDVLAAVLDLVTPSEIFDVIYSNDDVIIYRVFTQTRTKPPMEFNVTFIGERSDQESWLITSGIIRTGEYLKELEYEKVGKRILYNAIRQHWNIRF